MREADRVVHAAAESFVDRSIEDSRAFVVSNVLGTQVVLEACRELQTPMVLVSTDEIYGSGGPEGVFAEDAPMQPRNPYAASKAGADLLARSYVITYGTAVSTVRGTNTFGPRQHPEKAIPTFAIRCAAGSSDPPLRRRLAPARVALRSRLRPRDRHGDGPRRARRRVQHRGGTEMSNVELARRICAYLGADQSLITFVEDRPGHDFRYGLSWEPLEMLGWRPATPFSDGLAITLAWYRDHPDPVDEVPAGAPA